MDGILDDSLSTFPDSSLAEGSEFDFTLHFLNLHNELSASITWPGGSVSDFQFGDIDLNASGVLTDSGEITADAGTDFSELGWPFIGHWSLADVYNVQPSATLTVDHGDSSGADPLKLGLLDPDDPSSDDRSAGLRYSFSKTFAGLADTYSEAGTSQWGSFVVEEGDETFFARIFDKDGGRTDYPSTYSMPTLNWGSVRADRISMNWNDIATDEVHWLVQRAPDVSGHPGAYSTVATLNPNTTAYTDTSLTQNTRYWYRVRAQGTVGTESDTIYSAKRAITTLERTASVTGATADRPGTGNTINIDWNDQSGATFSVYRATTDYFSLVGLTPIYTGTTSYYSDTSSKSQITRYFYKIVASEAGKDDSLAEERVYATTPPVTPTGLEAFVVSGTKVQLYWDKTESNKGYQVFRDTTSSFAPSASNRITGSGYLPWYTDSYLDTTASANHTYYYKIVAEYIGVAASAPTAAVAADTGDIYAPAIEEFDDEMLVDTVYSVDVSGTSGLYHIPVYTGHGALVSVSLLAPDDENTPFEENTDFTLVNNATTTQYVDFTAVRDGPYVISLVRRRGATYYREGVKVLLNANAGPAAETPIPPGYKATPAPTADIYFVSSATGNNDNGFLTRIRGVLAGSGAPVVSIGSVDDVITYLMDWEDNNPNGNLGTITIIDHGQGGWIGFGSGLHGSTAGTYLSWAGSGAVSQDIENFTEELWHLRKYHSLDKVKFYQCELAKITFGQPLLKKISELSRRDPNNVNNLTTGVEVTAYGGEVFVAGTTFVDAAWYIAKNDNPWTWRDQ